MNVRPNTRFLTQDQMCFIVTSNDMKCIMLGLTCANVKEDSGVVQVDYGYFTEVN